MYASPSVTLPLYRQRKSWFTGSISFRIADQYPEKSAPTVDMEIGMAITAVIFDAFGTTLRITSPSHPYRQLLREGAKLGRRPTSGDAHKLLTLDAGIREAADLLSIQIAATRMAEIESELQREIESIEVFQDALDAITLLREHGIATTVCSNLAALWAGGKETPARSQCLRVQLRARSHQA